MLLVSPFDPNVLTSRIVRRPAAVITDPTNIAFDEVLYPGLVEESMDIELAELKEEELKVRAWLWREGGTAGAGAAASSR